RAIGVEAREGEGIKSLVGAPHLEPRGFYRQFVQPHVGVVQERQADSVRESEAELSLDHMIFELLGALHLGRNGRGVNQLAHITWGGKRLASRGTNYQEQYQDEPGALHINLRQFR